MNWIRKVAAAVKEIDTKGKIKLGFSGIVARGDLNKEEDIVSTNNRVITPYSERYILPSKQFLKIYF